jgi:ABC-type Zn2+ transport system substrate-binding protein/surface adhesin
MSKRTQKWCNNLIGYVILYALQCDDDGDDDNNDDGGNDDNDDDNSDDDNDDDDNDDEIDRPYWLCQSICPPMCGYCCCY